jgi:hypothetical protein
MSPMRPEDPPLPSTSPLSANVAHVRTLLSEAAHGPESTRGLAVDLMVSLIADGYLNSATWILAPSPLDDLGEVVFFLRSSADGETSQQDWRGNAELANVITEARDLTARTETVEVWSGNGPGLRRLVLVGYDGAPLTYLAPDAGNFDGEGSLVHSAVTDWQDHASDQPATTISAAPRPLAAEPPAEPSDPPVSHPQPAAVEPGVVGDAQAVAHAVQEALNHLSVEVDLGSIEELVVASVRTALAERPSAGSEILEFLEGPLDETVGRAVAAALAEQLPAAVDQSAATILPPAIAAAPDPGVVPGELEELVQRSVAQAIDVSLARLLPEVVERALAPQVLALSPDTVHDPFIEYARRTMTPLESENEQDPSALADGRSHEAKPYSWSEDEDEDDESARLRVLRADEIL